MHTTTSTTRLAWVSTTATLLLLLLLHAQTVHAILIPTQYNLRDQYIGKDFLTWKFENFDDPTHGRVNYVDKDTAFQRNLISVTDDKFIMRADSWSTVPKESRGRDSIRIHSPTTHDEALVVLDLTHMPEGCGTWPAFWTLSEAGPWPHGGEIDIIEGVHDSDTNLSSLHTIPNCTMSMFRLQTGISKTTNCDTAVDYNTGCGTTYLRPFSYGRSFNRFDGGWYVMQRSRKGGINIWFWSRNDWTVPSDVKYGSPNVTIGWNWPPPDVRFQYEQCDYDAHFDPHAMIFDLTFCGDWAGNTFADACRRDITCADFVDNNPQSFQNAYWEINSLRVFTQ
ncbi:glycoside hydrolase family 16 protein [Amanita thiersii Skay4041]|uniref:Glycoside hydrolase family 16 protein n=1 Tax=Amanita thiersii Skay4041 TaxID=703135 RepID=A0A2A9NH93_9AGAR|nr:glycoside hydrolase family 16 protein [Amanita thiersii Skay4041]